MQPIKPCNTYHAVAAGTSLLRCRDGRSVFKVYFLDIIGRPDPARTVWSASGMTPSVWVKQLDGIEGVEGIGFITAFPHITKAFRFGPEAETVLNVRAWSTRDLKPLDLARGDGYAEFACLAEALLAADEYRLWADAETVEAYLRDWSDAVDCRVARHDKLRAAWTNTE